MSITDELREYVINADGMGMTHGHAKCIYAIADRIDAEHERMFHALTINAEPMTDESMVEHGWVRLPVDADGVPIHVGDRLEHVNGAFTANDMTVSIDGIWRAWDGENGHTVLLAKCHHHKPTVEDVLREFAREIDADAYGITDAKVAEFAARLQLREDS